MRGANTLIPARFLTLVGHLCVLITLLWENQQSVKHCLPSQYHGQFFQIYHSRAMDFVVGGLAGVGATFFSNPFDVVKTRMQLQGELKKKGQHAVHYRNILHAIITIIKHDGILSLQQALLAGMLFSWSNNAVRFGLYTMADNYALLRNENGDTKFFNSLIFSGLAGAMGGLFGSPFQLIKTQMMSMSSKKIAVGTQHEHKGFFYAAQSILAKDGLMGLFRGAHGMMLRNGLGSGAQMSVYETSKDWMKANNVLQQSKYLAAFAASNLGAVVKTATLTPMDVIMTRLYNQGLDEKGVGKLYSGVVDCARKITATEGLLAFYKGMGPSYLRQAPHTVLLLIFWDMLKDLQKSFDKKT